MSDFGLPTEQVPHAEPHRRVVEFLHMDLDSGAIVPMASDGASCWLAEELNWQPPTELCTASRRAQIERELSLLPQGSGAPPEEDDFLLQLADLHSTDRGG